MKVRKIIIVFLTCILGMTTIVNASGVNMTSIFSGLTPDTGMADLGNAILAIIRAIAGTVAVVAAIVLGIRYVYSAPGEKATIKNRAIPFILGGTLIFAASYLVEAVYDISSGLL